MNAFPLPTPTRFQACFDDRVRQQRLELVGHLEALTAHTALQAKQVLARAEAHAQAGGWCALLIEYECAHWFDSAMPQPHSIAEGPSGYGAHPRLIAALFERGEWSTFTPQAQPTTGLSRATAGISKSQYLHAVGEIRERIARGEFYQVNYTFPLHLAWQGEALTLYESLLTQQSCAYAACLQWGEESWLSLSPELFVRREGSRLVTRPMKGTAPRFTDPVLDDQAGKTLIASTKDRAENLMIVDLLRNDLGRIARPGTVRVQSLFDLEPYPQVWQMTSTVEAEAPQVDLWSILQALFPCGSVTGAPKIAAMQHIQRAEVGPRGVYCGSVGWMGPGGDFCLNVAIRTLHLHANGHGRYAIGSGVVYDSEPEIEWQECLWKARSLGVAISE